jgi:hypothetical protein
MTVIIVSVGSIFGAGDADDGGVALLFQQGCHRGGWWAAAGCAQPDHHASEGPASPRWHVGSVRAGDLPTARLSANVARHMAARIIDTLPAEAMDAGAVGRLADDCFCDGDALMLRYTRLGRHIIALSNEQTRLRRAG